MPAVKKKRKPRAELRYATGDRVRVRPGIQDVDYPDVPLGGWAGTVAKVERNGLCNVRWSRATLEAIHPVVKSRSETDGLDLESYWLSQDDLERDPGGPLQIECPEEVTNKPLSPQDQDDRLRLVFGLASSDPLPEVDDEALQIYHAYLLKNLSFPFAAEHTPQSGHLFRHSCTVRVTGLGDPDDEPLIDETYGVLCEARHRRRGMTVPLGELEVDKGKPNRQPIKDYCHWFWNYS